MTTERILDHDPITNTTTYHAYDHSTGETHIRTTSDVQPILESNKIERNDAGYWDRAMKADQAHGVKVGSIPMALLDKWQKEEGIDYSTQEGLQRIVARLNDPDWAHLKIVNKQL